MCLNSVPSACSSPLGQSLSLTELPPLHPENGGDLVLVSLNHRVGAFNLPKFDL